MASWQRKHGKYVFVYTRKHGKQSALARKLTRHLDLQDDSQIQAWVTAWSVLNESDAQVPDDAAKTKLLTNVEQFVAHLKNIQRSPKTVWEHRSCLLRFVVPFFTERKPPLFDVNTWPSASIRFQDYLKRQNVTQSNRIKATTALKQFYGYLQDEGIVNSQFSLRIRNPPRPFKSTPLIRTVSPQDILEFARTCQDRESKLMALIGYFFSLRPYELFSLRRCDFSAGTTVTVLECSRVFRDSGLFDKLVVNIARQRVATGGFTSPKCHSKGLVCCFNEDAARQIVGILNSYPANELLFKRLPDTSIKQWKRSGIENIQLKDLRRSSLYHLGHYSSLSLVALKNHARHRYVSTTELYTRRPEELNVDPEPELNLGI